MGDLRQELRREADGIPSDGMSKPSPIEPLSAAGAERQVAATDGTVLRYRVEGAGPPIVLVHGVGASLESWDDVVARLDGFTVVRADLRGHGRSGLITECRIEDFLADMELVAAAAGLDRFHLVGFSLGGLIAQHFALAQPDAIRTLTLVSTVSGRTDDERAKVLERARLVREQGIESVVRAAEDRWFSPAFKARHPELISQRLAQLTANDQASYAAAYAVFAEADRGLDVARIEAPTLVITGEQDIGSNPRMARALHAAIAGSELHVLPEYRHSILLEGPDQVADLLLDFLRRRVGHGEGTR